MGAPFDAARLEALARLVPPLAHEVNNSLAVIGGCRDLGAPGEERTSGRETRRTAGLVRALAKLAREVEPVREAMDPVPVTTEAALLVAPLAACRGVELEARTIASAVVEGDPARLYQALVILLVGAVETADLAAGAGAPRVRVGLDRRAGNVVLVVTRTGPGRRPELGGRSAAAALEALDDGRSSFRRRSFADRATSWRLTLSALDRTPGTTADPPARTTPGKVLVVERESQLADLVAAVLGESGHEVEIAVDVDQALASLDERSFDLVLFDRDSAEPRALERLSGKNASIGVMSDDRRAIGEERPVLIKPFRPRELTEFVRSCLVR